MMNIRTVLIPTWMALSLAGCGGSASPPNSVPTVAAKPDVIVTVDGERHTCLVALSSEAQGSAIACDEVVAFVRDELRVPGGSTYDLKVLPTTNEAETAKVETSLKGAGYRPGAAQARR
jgi:hypothetical protein